MSSAPRSCRKARAAWLLAAACLTACSGPGVAVTPPVTGNEFSLERQALSASSAPGVVATAGAPPAGQPSAPVDVPTTPVEVPTAAPVSNGGSSSGGSGGGLSGPITTLTSYLLLGGQAVEVVAGAEVALPPTATGEVSLFAPGLVPSSLDLTGVSSPPPALHPASLEAIVTPPGTASVQGTLLPDDAGVNVNYRALYRSDYRGLTSVSGQGFRFDVPVQAAERGYVVAQDMTYPPRLGVANAALQADGVTDVGAINLATPGTPALVTPTPPAGMKVVDSWLGVTSGGGAPCVLILDTENQPVPTYQLPGFTQIADYVAVSDDRRRATTTRGPVGQVPDFLAAPDLSRIPASIPGNQRLTWPAVPGASVYTLTLTVAGQAAPATWEGATTQTSLALPSLTGLAGKDLVLTVCAWDDPSVTLYSLAAVRQLRVPADLTGTLGRFSAAQRGLKGL